MGVVTGRRAASILARIKPRAPEPEPRQLLVLLMAAEIRRERRQLAERRQEAFAKALGAPSLF